MIPKVHCVTTLGQAEALERAAIRPVSPWLVARVRLRTALANLCVRLFRALWFRKPAPLMELKHVVVYTFGTLGDHLVAMPALAALRKACPQARITLLSSTGGIGPRVLEDLLADHRLVDAIVCVPDPPTKRRGLKVDYAPALAALRPCDLFVNLSPFGNRGLANAVFRELFIARHVGARSAIGFRVRGWANRKNLRTIQRLFVHNEPGRCGEVLSDLGLLPESPEMAIPSFPEARERIRQRLKSLGGEGPLVVFNPGAKFEVKCWPSDRFASLGRVLQRETRARLIAVGTEEEKKIAMDSLQGTTGLNLAGETSLPELVEILRTGNLCITNDTGTMHLSVLVGCPTVALFTTRVSPRHWFPLGERLIALMSFVKDHYDFRDEGGPHESLLAIEVGDVTAAAKSLLADAACAIPLGASS
jgi:ADP-heptose:LPS heptosyltransferase